MPDISRSRRGVRSQPLGGLGAGVPQPQQYGQVIDRGRGVMNNPTPTLDRNQPQMGLMSPRPGLLPPPPPMPGVDSMRSGGFNPAPAPRPMPILGGLGSGVMTPNGNGGVAGGMDRGLGGIAQGLRMPPPPPPMPQSQPWGAGIPGGGTMNSMSGMGGFSSNPSNPLLPNPNDMQMQRFGGGGFGRGGY